MKLIKRISLIGVLAIFGLAFFVSANAQEVKQVRVEKKNCSVAWNNVIIAVGKDKDVYSPGETINAHGLAANFDNMDISDGSIIAKIFRVNNSEDLKNVNTAGDYLVNEEIVLTDINIGAKKEKDLKFDIKIPEFLRSGDYKVSLYFLPEGKLNVGGRITAAEMVIGKIFFKSSSEMVNGIVFDRMETKLNGRQYNHTGDAFLYKKGDKIEMTQLIKNEFKTDKKVNISYKLYEYDRFHENNLINSKQEDIIISALGSKTISYNIDDVTKPNTVLKIEMQTEDGQNSVINVRMISDVSDVRINNAGIDKFPLKKGEEVEIFACISNGVVPSSTEKGKVILTIEDKKGNEIYKEEKEGILGLGSKESISSIVSKFKADENYNWLKLKAVAFNEKNEEVDKYEKIYDCQKIDSTKCIAEEAPLVKDNVSIVRIIFWIIGILLIISLVIIVIMKIRNRNNNKAGGAISGGNLSILFLVFLLSAFLFVPNISLADVIEEGECSPNIFETSYSITEESCCGVGSDCLKSNSEIVGSSSETTPYFVYSFLPGLKPGVVFCSGDVSFSNQVNVTNDRKPDVDGNDINVVKVGEKATFDYSAEGSYNGSLNPGKSGCIWLRIPSIPAVPSDILEMIMRVPMFDTFMGGPVVAVSPMISI